MISKFLTDRSLGNATILIALMMFLSCATNPVTGKKDFMLLSEQDEIRMGRNADPSVVESFGLYDDPELASFLDQMGQEMAAISHRPHLTYTFRLLDGPVVNAFALPGGYVYFTRGILAHFNSVAECAGVLGHEIGHITARHSAKQYSSQVAFQAGYITGVLLSPEFAKVAGASEEAFSLLFLSFSRDHESQSDRLGVEYSTAIGYDATQLANFFETLDRMEGETGDHAVPDFYATHPDPAHRSEDVVTYTQQVQAENPEKDYKVERDRYLRMIDGLVYGNDPRHGFVEEEVYYSPRFKLTFPIPRRWQTEVSHQGIMAAPNDGDALMLFQPDSARSPDEAARSFAEQFQLKLSTAETTSFNGLDGKLIKGDLVNPQNPGEAYKLVAYFVEFNGEVYRLLALTLNQSYVRYDDRIMDAVQGLRPLTDPDKLNRQPERISIFSASRNATIQEVLEEQGLPEDRIEEVLHLNGMEPDFMVSQGMLLKTIDIAKSAKS